MQALDGLRVLDLARQGPGPFCSMMLSDLGADVLLVEPPAGGAPPAESSVDEARERRRAHDATRRNKESLVLNLREQEARDIFYKLVPDVDIVMESFRPGVVKRLGVDWETLRELNSRLIYCSISGFGQTGPYAQLAGHDINYIAMAGMLGMIGQPGQPPTIPSAVIADFAAGGQAAVVAILAAVVARQTTGQGQYLDVAMTDSVLYTLASAASGVLAGGPAPKPGEGLLAGGVPYINVYETKDGRYVAIASFEPKFFAALCEVMGRPDFIPLQNDSARHPEIREHLETMFLQKTRDEWFEELRFKDVCIAPVLMLDEALNDEHNRAREMVVEVDDPRVGRVEQIGIGIKFSDTPGRVRKTGPHAGEQTDAVLDRLGYSADAVAALRERGVVA